MFRELYHSSLYIVCVCFLPLTSLAVMNTALMRAVQTSRARGKKRLRLQERKRNDTTIMLIGVVVIFFMCQTPAVASHVIWAFYSDVYLQKLPMYVLNEISNFLVTLNSAINIVPYYFFGRRFREEFCRFFCKSVICERRSNLDILRDGYNDRRRSSQYSGYSTSGPGNHTNKLHAKALELESAKLAFYLKQRKIINEKYEENSMKNDDLLQICDPDSTATEPAPTGLIRKCPSTYSL